MRIREQTFSRYEVCLGESHRRSVDLVTRYVDQSFSGVDAIVLLSADEDRRVDRLWTVDSTIGAYRLSHQVLVSSPDR
jgi:hypothetical protein